MPKDKRTPEQIIGLDRLMQLTFEGYKIVEAPTAQPAEAGVTVKALRECIGYIRSPVRLSNDADEVERRKRLLDRAEAALATCPSEAQITVEWFPLADGRLKAESEFGSYFIAIADGEVTLSFDNEHETSLLFSGKTTTNAASAAQADYDQRIRSALVPAPAPQDEALKAENERLRKEQDTHLRSAANHFANSCELADRALTAEAALPTPAPQGMKLSSDPVAVIRDDPDPTLGYVSTAELIAASQGMDTAVEAEPTPLPFMWLSQHDFSEMRMPASPNRSILGWRQHQDRNGNDLVPLYATPQPAPSVNTPWGWVCSGEGDGWKETDKLVRDPELVARYRGNPNWHTIVPLYPQPAPSGVNAEMLAALKRIATLRYVEDANEPFDEALDTADAAIAAAEATRTKGVGGYTGLEGRTFAVQHNPNCPSPWLVRLPGKTGLVDLKGYGDPLRRSRHETGDILGFGKTLDEAASAALSAAPKQGGE